MATRKMSRKSKMSKSRKGSRKASSWAMTVKKVYAGLKKKMGKKATLGMAMKMASRARKH
jgi:hypothetical protein